MRSILAAFATACLTAGCSTLVADNAPHDWPGLKIEYRTATSGAALYRACDRMLAQACAKIDFKALTCTLWLPPEPSPELIAHEEGHCRGMDHPGDTNLRDAWARRKETRDRMHNMADRLAAIEGAFRVLHHIDVTAPLKISP